jgi:hypothetical protein
MKEGLRVPNVNDAFSTFCRLATRARCGRIPGGCSARVGSVGPFAVVVVDMEDAAGRLWGRAECRGGRRGGPGGR